MMLLLLFACIDSADSETGKSVDLDPDFVGPMGRRLTVSWVTWIGDDGVLYTRYPDDNPVPGGTWLEVTGQGLMCARNDTEVFCWGKYENPGMGTFPGNFLQVSAGTESACAVDAEHALHCWGNISDAPVTEGVEFVAVGDQAACVIESSGSLTCWGDGMDYWMSNWPRYDTWVDVSVGQFVSCALASNGRATCWGTNQEAEDNEPDPDDVYSMVSAGGGAGCAMTPTGGIDCWLDPWSGDDYSMAEEGFLEISATTGFGTCGLPPDGDPICSQDDD